MKNFIKKYLLTILSFVMLIGFISMLMLYMLTAMKNKKAYEDLKKEYNKLASDTDAEIQKRDKAVNGLILDLRDKDDTIVKIQKELNDYSDENSELKKQLNDLNNQKDELLEEIEQLKISKANREKEKEPAHTEALSVSDAPTQDGMTYLGTYELTAYIETGNPCADGVYPSVGYTVACNDPSLWHRWIYIEGMGQYYVHDVGGMPSYNIIDVYLGTYDACIQFGRQSANVYLMN